MTPVVSSIDYTVISISVSDGKKPPSHHNKAYKVKVILTKHLDNFFGPALTVMQFSHSVRSLLPF